MNHREVTGGDLYKNAAHYKIESPCKKKKNIYFPGKVSENIFNFILDL